MTLSTTARSVTQVGNGVTTEWPFSFKVLDADHLVVQVIDISAGSTTTLSTSDYSVAGIGDASGGTVTYPLTGSPLTSDDRIVITRTVPYLQELDIQNQEGFFPEVVEDQFDLIVMMVQQIASQVGNAITAPIADLAALLLTLPIAEERAEKYLYFDSDGSVSVTGTAPAVQYQGAFTTANAPTTRLSGSALQSGDLYFDTTDNRLKVWNGASWVTAVDTSGGVADGDKGDITVSSSGTVYSINAGVVDTAELVDAAVETVKIADNNVTTGKIADNAVTLAKMEHGTSGDILYYGAAGVPLRLAKGTDGQALKLVSGLPAWGDPVGAWALVDTIYDFSTDGAVASVETPNFADGFEYRVDFEEMSPAGASPQLMEVELYGETTGAYEAVDVNVSRSRGAADTWNGRVHLHDVRESLPVHYVDTLEGTSNSSSDTGITMTATEKVLKARLGWSSSNIDGGKIRLYRRVL